MQIVVLFMDSVPINSGAVVIVWRIVVHFDCYILSQSRNSHPIIYNVLRLIVRLDNSSEIKKKRKRKIRERWREEEREKKEKSRMERGNGC